MLDPWPMLVLTPAGLYCPLGDFYIDPSKGVENAIITHAHADHARRGSRRYYSVHSGEGLLRQRVGKKIDVITHGYGEKFSMGAVEVSLHPAGHILGSSQVRIQYGQSVWVASGDYKREADPTCEPFESVPCDVFVTEATFGTPSYVWPKNVEMGREIWEWWQSNAARGFNSVLLAYSLGKAQRVLGLLSPWAQKPIYCHSAVTDLNACYKEQGIHLAETLCLSQVGSDVQLRGELLLVPHAFLESPQAKILGGRFQTAFASGWMSQRNPMSEKWDHGFVISDHADWNDLLRTIQETGARKVYVQHRGRGALVRHLRSQGIEAYPESDLKTHDAAQMVLF